MHYIAFSYEILAVSHKEGCVIWGEKYNAFKEASSIEKYILFFTSYIFDGTSWGRESYTYVSRIQDFLLTIDEKNKEICDIEDLLQLKNQELQIPATDLMLYDKSSNSLVPIFEELGLLKLGERTVDKNGRYRYNVEVSTLMSHLAYSFNEEKN